jgi:TetR/AcrR family transcriptional repressor of nem operon
MPRTEDFNREEVLDKAQHAFWLKGFHGTSMQDLVDATGLNRSSIYNSFGSKMELYQQALRKYQVQNASVFDKALDQERNAIETIGLIFLYIMEEIKCDSESKGCMIINCFSEMGNQDPRLREFLEAHQAQLLEIFTELVARGQADGSIRKDEKSRALAHYLVSVYQGFRITGMHSKDPYILKSIIQNVLKSIA